MIRAVDVPADQPPTCLDHSHDNPTMHHKTARVKLSYDGLVEAILNPSDYYRRHSVMYTEYVIQHCHRYYEENNPPPCLPFHVSTVISALVAQRIISQAFANVLLTKLLHTVSLFPMTFHHHAAPLPHPQTSSRHHFNPCDVNKAADIAPAQTYSAEFLVTASPVERAAFDQWRMQCSHHPNQPQFTSHDNNMMQLYQNTPSHSTKTAAIYRTPHVQPPAGMTDMRDPNWNTNLPMSSLPFPDLAMEFPHLYPVFNAPAIPSNANIAQAFAPPEDMHPQHKPPVDSVNIPHRSDQSVLSELSLPPPAYDALFCFSARRSKKPVFDNDKFQSLEDNFPPFRGELSLFHGFVERLFTGCPHQMYGCPAFIATKSRASSRGNMMEYTCPCGHVIHGKQARDGGMSCVYFALDIDRPFPHYETRQEEYPRIWALGR